MKPILSLFPGIDLLGRGFEAEGYCVVRGPDLLWGGDICNFHPPAEVFAGIIGGSPCQDFSLLRRDPPSGNGIRMLTEFVRCVSEAQPDWFLLENVPTVPDVIVADYSVQRLNLMASECGGKQRRLRCFQFGSKDGLKLRPERTKPVCHIEPAALATEGKRQTRRGFADFCELQGLPGDFDLPGMSVAAKYRAVGNGVPVMMARVVARAVLVAVTGQADAFANRSRLCICDCGRPVSGRAITAGAGCRKRMERKRRDNAKRC